MTVYGSEIKTGFAFFDEVFHRPSLAVNFDNMCSRFSFFIMQKDTIVVEYEAMKIDEIEIMNSEKN